MFCAPCAAHRGLCAGKVYTRNYGRRSAPGFEGSMAPTVCAQKEYAGCVGREFCIESYLYQRIRESIDNVIDAITLAEMLEIEKQQSLQRPKHLCGAREGI